MSKRKKTPSPTKKRQTRSNSQASPFAGGSNDETSQAGPSQQQLQFFPGIPSLPAADHLSGLMRIAAGRKKLKERLASILPRKL